MTTDDITGQVRRFIGTNFLFDDQKVVDENQSLIGSGIIDSTGILELVGFLERTYQVKFEDQELVTENFDTISAIGAFLQKKQAAVQSGKQNADS